LLWLGAFVGWLAGSVLRIRRSHVEAAMAAAGLPRPAAQARAMYAALGASALEFLWLAARGRRALACVRIEGASHEAWERALAKRRGVVVAASHTGNWDLAACAIAGQVDLTVVTKHLSAGWLDRFWQSTRARLGVKLADARAAMDLSRRALRRGGAVAMMIDQAPSSPRCAVACEFLGQAAWVDRAPAALAARARAPLVVATARRAADGAHVLAVLSVLEPPPRPTRAWIDHATLAATCALDGFVRAHPDQWLWMHRRWKPMLAAPCKATRSSSPAAASTAA
jgi:KDO2-lipid IV(A) lauroyltransferase